MFDLPAQKEDHRDASQRQESRQGTYRSAAALGPDKIAEAFKFEVSLTEAIPSQTGSAVMQVTLASVLARHDQECLVSELEALQTESEVSLSTKAETQAVCGHLQNVGCCRFD